MGDELLLIYFRYILKKVANFIVLRMNQNLYNSRNPIIMNFPSTLKTQRLEIRPIRPGDGVCLHSLISENFEFLSKWITWLKKTLSQEECEMLCRKYYADFILRHELYFLVLIKDTNTAIGSINISDIDWSIPKGSIGYWGALNYSGNGYMTEATGAITSFSFGCLGFKRLTILCGDLNEKSWKIAERLGFTLELRAKGLIDSVKPEGLCLARQYVRWDAEGIDPFKDSF